MKVVVAHKGMYVYATDITGREAHSSTPHLGGNAVLAASRIVAFLADLEAELREKVRKGAFATGDLEFDPPYTTITATVLSGGTAVNIVPRDASLDWGFRLMPGMSVDDVLKPLDAFIADVVLPELRATAPEASIVTKASAVVPPLVPEPGSEAERLALALTGGNATHAVPFGTEGGLYQSLGVPTVICGPGSIEQAHKANEFVAVSQLEACGTFLDKLGTWLVDGLTPIWGVLHPMTVTGRRRTGMTENSRTPVDTVFHIAEDARWRAAESDGYYRGGPLDERDGFIHCSTAAQLRETVRLHLAGREGLVLLTIDAARLGADLKWETSRGGALFPHLHAALPLDAVRRADPLPLDAEGNHVFPDHVPGD